MTFQSEPGADFYSNFWLTAVTIDPSRAGVDREAVRLGLLEENIESRPLWKPMHLQPVFSGAKSSKLKAQREAILPPTSNLRRPISCRVFGGAVSEGLFERGLCLPSGSNMTEADMERIEKALMRIFGSA